LIGGAPEDLVGGIGGGSDGGLPVELGVVVEGLGEDADVLRLAGGGGEVGENGGVEAGYVGDVVEVDILEEVAVLDAVFDADVLVLVVEVLAPLGEADSGEALEVEAGVVAATEVAVGAED
jgi:acetylglutamate kinase